MRTPLPVAFVAAAGPRIGFGHLVRAGSLADALNAERTLVLRGSASAKRVASRLGWRVFPSLAALAKDARPGLVVIDEPSGLHGSRAVNWASRAQVRSVAVRDLGLRTADADLVVDGSIVRLPGSPSADLQGPRFAILSPRIARLRRARPRRHPRRVLIALGGGVHVRRLGVAIARGLAAAMPNLAIELAAGFSADRRRSRLHGRMQWIAPDRLPLALATAAVAVVAGGVTLYEACALATPIVTVPVVRAQRITTRAFARAGAAVDAAGATESLTCDRAVAAVLDLVRQPKKAARFANRAARLVDGRGASRVAATIRPFVTRLALEERRHAA